LTLKKAQEVIDLLGLTPLPVEGGYFKSTYRSPATVNSSAGSRDLMSCIYYLLTPTCRSLMHRLKADEIFHFYAGDPVEMLLLFADGQGRTVTLGPDLGAGQIPQLTVPAGVWQGARLVASGEFALMGTTVAPGFVFEDFELGERAALIEEYPALETEIVNLT